MLVILPPSSNLSFVFLLTVFMQQLGADAKIFTIKWSLELKIRSFNSKLYFLQDIFNLPFFKDSLNFIVDAWIIPGNWLSLASTSNLHVQNWTSEQKHSSNVITTLDIKFSEWKWNEFREIKLQSFLRPLERKVQERAEFIIRKR